MDRFDYSPDGTYVAYVADVDTPDDDRIAFIILGNGGSRAFVADLATFPPGAATELSNPPFQFAPANRSPSGRYVVYVDDDQLAVITQPDGGARPRLELIRDVAAPAPVWIRTPDDLNVLNCKFAPEPE